MHPISELFWNKPFFCALLAWAVAQAIKGLVTGFRFHEWSFETFFGAGGMPSSHTSAVVALTMSLGFTEGFGTPLFAISAVFATIVMYDATGVRRETGKQGKAINELINELLDIKGPDGKRLIPEELKEKIGHTPLEVIMGFFLGVLCSLLFCTF